MAPPKGKQRAVASGTHPFDLKARDYLALRFVAYDSEILRHEAYLHKADDPQHHTGVEISDLTVRQKAYQFAHDLAAEVGVRESFMYAAYSHHWERTGVEDILERFRATSHDYNLANDNLEMLTDVDLEVSQIRIGMQALDIVIEPEERFWRAFWAMRRYRGADFQLQREVPLINAVMQDVHARAAALSASNPQTAQDANTRANRIQRMLQQRFPIGSPGGLSTDLDGDSALYLYWTDISSFSTASKNNFRDILVLGLGYQGIAVLDKINLCREGRRGNKSKALSTITIFTNMITDACVYLAHAYQIPWDVLQRTYDRQTMANETCRTVKRDTGTRPPSVIEQAKAYAIIDRLQHYAVGAHDQPWEEETQDYINKAPSENLLSGVASHGDTDDDCRYQPGDKYEIVEVVRKGRTIRTVKSRKTVTQPSSVHDEEDDKDEDMVSEDD